MVPLVRRKKDDLGSREEAHDDNRHALITQMARESIVKVSPHVKFHPHFLHLAHSFCRAARGR